MTESMSDFRRYLDFIDKDLVSLLEKRTELSRRIGKYKKRNGLFVEDLNKEKMIIEEKIKNSRLSKDFLRKIFSLIFEESSRVQKEA